MEFYKQKATRKKNIYEKKINVCAYVRVSTKLEKQTNSLESQKNYFIQKIQRMQNWNFAGIYEDDGISGRTVEKRKGFMKMYQDCLEGKIDLILTKSMSRFARNTIDSLEYIRKLKDMNIGIIFEEEHINSLELGSEMLLTVFASIAQIESENQSQRVKMGNAMLEKQGKLVDPCVPTGYKVTKSGEIKVVKKEAEIIKRIFNEVINGKSLSSIAKQLNNEKIKTRKNGKWTVQTIQRMIRNKRYINETKFIPSKNSKKGYYIPLVDKEIFENANKILDNISNSRAKYNKENLFSIFNRRVKCGLCGATMYIGNRKNANPFLCTNRDDKFGGRTSEEHIIQSFHDLVIHINKKKKIFNQKIESINRDITKNKILIDKLDKDLNNIINQYINKKINYRNYLEQKEQIQKQIDKLYYENDLQTEIKTKINNILSCFNKLKVEKEFDDKLFFEMVTYIVIGKFINKEPEYYYVRFLFDPLVKDKEANLKQDIKYFNREFKRLFLITSIQDRQSFENKKHLLDGNKIKVAYEIRKER